MAALSLFFKADQIFVTGASRYSQQQVLQASGIRQGGNLFLLNKHQAAAAITDQRATCVPVPVRVLLTASRTAAESSSGGRIAS